MKLTLTYYIVFAASTSASLADSFLNGHSLNDCRLKTQLFGVLNLQDDLLISSLRIQVALVRSAHVAALIVCGV